MKPAHLRKLDEALSAYLDEMVVGMERLERRRALEAYVTGLLLDGERKSIEPVASRLVEDPRELEAMRQRLQQCVCNRPTAGVVNWGGPAGSLRHATTNSG